MRNLLDNAPTRDLHGGQAYAVQLVDCTDLSGRDVLDIGCGFGWFELVALDRGATSITGIEVSERDLDTVRRHITDGRASLVVGSAIDLPFESGSFDTVVCWEVLEHIPPHTEPRAFAEIHRVLRPGGTLYLSTPYASGLARAFDPAWWLIGHRHYYLRDLARLAKDARFQIESLEVRGGIWQIAAILDLYVAKWIFRRPPFLETTVNRRMDQEMIRGGGCATCFLKCRA